VGIPRPDSPVFRLLTYLLGAYALALMGCRTAHPAVSEQADAPLIVLEATGVLVPPGSPMGTLSARYTLHLRNASSSSLVLLGVTRADQAPLDQALSAEPELAEGRNLAPADSITLVATDQSAASVRELERDRSLPRFTLATQLWVALRQGSTVRYVAIPISHSALPQQQRPR